jgi:hypothetical protein
MSEKTKVIQYYIGATLCLCLVWFGFDALTLLFLASCAAIWVWWPRLLQASDDSISVTSRQVSDWLIRGSASYLITYLITAASPPQDHVFRVIVPWVYLVVSPIILLILIFVCLTVWVVISEIVHPTRK